MRRQTPPLSKDFKKKQGYLDGRTQQLDLNRLSELRAKLEKDKEMTKTTTGRRFKDVDVRSSNSSFSSASKGSQQQPPPNKKILSQEKLMRETPKAPSRPTDKKKAVQTMTKALPPQRIFLNELKQQSQQQSQLDSLRSSNTFEREKDKQKQNNKEVYDLLKSVRLERFYDSFIEEGFDDRQSLTELSTDDLNRMKMKASHQQVLLEEVKKRVGTSTSIGPDFEDLEINRSCISSRNRMQTEPRLPGRPETASTFTAKTINTNQRPKPKPIGQLLNSSKSSSFLYSAGGSEFSLVPQTGDTGLAVRERKACCHCFKITLEPIASGYFFYCSKECIAADHKSARKHSPPRSKVSETASQRPLTQVPARAQLQQDLEFSQLTLTESMVRQYD